MAVVATKRRKVTKPPLPAARELLPGSRQALAGCFFPVPRVRELRGFKLGRYTSDSVNGRRAHVAGKSPPRVTSAVDHCIWRERLPLLLLPVYRRPHHGLRYRMSHEPFLKRNT